jgi:L-Ala-D/L-Glu epimerase
VIGTGPAATVVAVAAEPLSVPLREPFVIASGRVDATRAVLVTVTLRDGAGREVSGLGEAAALPPVTREDQPQVAHAIARAAPRLVGRTIAGLADAGAAADAAMEDAAAAAGMGAVGRAGLETALADAWARLAGVSLGRALGAGGGPLPSLVTDVTLPITAPERMAALATRHRAAGFTCFKVKVGRDWRSDRAALAAVAAAVPDARFRLDANGGFDAADALALLDAALSTGAAVECFEQPCARQDLAGMAAVTARSPVPVIADESFRDGADLDAIVAARAAHAVNLKLAKLGGPLAAMALGRQARAAGLALMAGAMVETRLGLVAMAHVVAALGGVDWVDLDTAFLLASDPFDGGWTHEGPLLTLTDTPGLGVSRAVP